MEWTPEQKQAIDKMIAEQKDKWVKVELEPLQNQVKELEQYKPVEKSDTEKALEQKEKELFDKEVNLYLKENGLAEFGEFFNVQNMDEVKDKTEKLNKILEGKKLNNSYIPDSHKSNDTYTKAEKNKDTVTMIGTKLSKLFK
jgi:molecular chaperone GrpE